MVLARGGLASNGAVQAYGFWQSGAWDAQARGL